MTAINLLLMLTSLASAVAYVHPPRHRLISLLQRTSSLSMSRPDQSHPYAPPRWAEGALTNPPKHGRLRLANLPTPLHAIGSNSAPRADGILARLRELDVTLYVKRDDATGGVELGGNKVRKLEFLLADALASGCDAVVTIGGEQSNHCRATAAASRMVGLSPHLILRTRRADAIHEKEDDIGWVGNILFDRMVGSTIYTCTPGEVSKASIFILIRALRNMRKKKPQILRKCLTAHQYGRIGSDKLVDSVCNHLRSKQQSQNNPYPIPVGGSNAIGTWGYINGVDELMQQLETMHDDDSEFSLDHVVFATGSGGTATGISVGLSLAFGSLGNGRHEKLGQPPQVHAVGVCDNPDYFYQTMEFIATDMGLRLPSGATTEQFVRDSVTVHQGKGRGYAFSTDEELDFILQFATETGISLDPVYSGKALYHFLKKVVEDDPESYRGKNILFWHTGGAIGLYEKGGDLLGRLNAASPVKRIDAYGKKGAGDDVVML